MLRAVLPHCMSANATFRTKDLCRTRPQAVLVVAEEGEGRTPCRYHRRCPAVHPSVVHLCQHPMVKEGENAVFESPPLLEDYVETHAGRPCWGVVLFFLVAGIITAILLHHPRRGTRTAAPPLHLSRRKFLWQEAYTYYINDSGG